MEQWRQEKRGDVVMRYTNHSGRHRVTSWVWPKFATMNLKKPATWAWRAPDLSHIWRMWAFFAALFIKEPRLFFVETEVF